MKFIKNRKISMHVFIILISLILFSSFSNIVKADTNNVGITYQGHVQNIGWQKPTSDGQIEGTVGESLRLEDLKISLSNALPGMNVTYRTYVENKGWTNWVVDGQEAGTIGQSLKLEAVEIKLNNAPNYHVQYQVHVQNIGWMDWTQDGQLAGTSGESLRIEAIRIKVVKDNNLAANSSQTTNSTQTANYNIKSTYQANVQNSGWQNWTADGEIAGTVGEGLRLESIKVGAQNLQDGMNIKYQVHVHDIGWMDWVNTGQAAGTTGQGLAIEAIRIQLEGMPGYHVQYQSQVQNLGWMPWTQDGQVSGTTGRTLRLEAIRIRIVKDQANTLQSKNVIISPSNNSSFFQYQNLELNGYALNQFGNKEINLYLDGGFLGNPNVGLDSSNINSAGYLNGNNSGYSFNLPIKNISGGTHTLTVEAVGNDQNLNEQTISFTVQELQPRMCIDTPTDSSLVKNEIDNLPVVGWSLSTFGVKTVQISLDGAYKGDATIGLSRPDVNDAFPNYINGTNSGFSYNLDVTSLQKGVHTLTVSSIGNDGITTSESIKIYKSYVGNQFTTNYNLTLQQAIDNQVNYGDPVSDSNGNWVTADRSTIQYYLDPNNFMDDYGIYQFLRLDYIQGVTVADLNKILAGKGILDGKGAQFLAAAQQSNVNPIYLVSHALLETGNGYSKLATGISVNGRTVYNLFGIGAYDSNANYYGSTYAYNKGWFSVDQAIYGGAQWISGDYINNSSYKQNTLYKMRWNPASPSNHQYATDVRWAYNQVYNIKKLTDIVENPILQFDIPQYK